MSVPQFVYPVLSDMNKVYQVKFDTEVKDPDFKGI